jgi:hypothetical protein
MSQVFQECSSLTDIVIPSNVTSIGDMTFEKCTSINSVTVYSLTPPTLGSNVFDNNATGRKIYVPAASLNLYKAATNWSTYADDIVAIS